jgi:beta-glucanase (GH16 family)
VATDFHVYGFEWREDKLTWYLDGVETYSVTKDETGWKAWPFDRPFYLILNFAFGGGWGGSQGVDLDALPQEYIIDYVRVYR